VTDTLVAEETEAPEEEDFTSSHETAPKPSKAKPLSDVPCPHCSTVYTKGPQRLRETNLKNHIRHHHKDAAPVKAKLPKSAAAAKAVPEPKAKARKPAGENLALLVSGGAQFAAKAGYMPLANALAFEAPAAGQAIDTAVAGTVIDRKIIQPLAGGAEKWEAVGAVLTLPIMIHLISVFPHLQPALEPQLRRAAEEILVLSVPTIRKKVDRDKKVTEALIELGHIDPAIALSEDPVGDILAGFFVGMAPVEEPQGADA
jgi:hypothetical protein